jgi:hypothetical protein
VFLSLPVSTVNSTEWGSASATMIADALLSFSRTVTNRPFPASLHKHVAKTCPRRACEISLDFMNAMNAEQQVYIISSTEGFDESIGESRGVLGEREEGRCKK